MSSAKSWCRRVLLCGILLTSLVQRHDAVVYQSPNADDVNYWRNNAENYLKNVLNYQENRRLPPNKAKNVIIFVGDGMGVATLSAGRIFKGQQAGRSGEEEQLVFDSFPNTGMSKTYNTDAQVPDSAGTATAMFSGVKTRSGVIGVDFTITETNLESAKLSSFMSWAQAEGKRTGIVTTTRVTHATPASTYAHIVNRDYECHYNIPSRLASSFKSIGTQMIEDLPGCEMKVILGGGKQCFRSALPSGGTLIDKWTLKHNPATSKYVQTTGQLRSVNLDTVDSLLGLFDDSHMTYNMLRDKSLNGEPSLSEMTVAAIKVLKREQSSGFALMVEGGRIDHAHHDNQARLALSEMVEFDKAVGAALQLVDLSETLIIVTADHSHALTFNGYPQRGNDILGITPGSQNNFYETLSYANGPGYYVHRWNSTSPHPADFNTWNSIQTMDRTDPSYRHFAGYPVPDETHGGEDVVVFANGPGSHLVRGTFEQNYIAYVMSYAACIGPAKRLNLACYRV